MVDKNNDVSVIIKTYAEDANKSLSTLITNLNTLNTNINKINTSLNKTKTKSSSAKKEVKSLSDTLKQLSSVSNTMKTSMNKMFDVGKMYLFWNVTKRIRDTLKSLINSSIDYIETQNLFDVSMASQSDKAYKFMNTMANTFAMARTELMNYQASFNNVLKSLPGLADETSYALSETLMKMAGDYSSLFNFTLPQAMEKFQAALTGSVKPIRDKTGLDITEKTIQGVATNLGVEKTVGQLNQVEKRLLRIIALQDQLREVGAMGDFAKTIESPSNQLKVLQQQLKELGTWIGNVFIGTIGKVLPYINGFVMALVAMAKALAIFVGYSETKYDDPLQVEDTTTSVEGLTSSLGGAASKAKELKKILMGFDVLNVITTPSEDSGGGGGGSATSIDPAILGALKDYDNLMGDVQMKATKIRDKIMDWLGFEKIINEETGEINWKLKDGNTKLKEIFETVKTIGTVLLGIFIVKKVADFIIFIGNLTLALGTLKKALKPVATALKKLIPTVKVSSRAGAATAVNWGKVATALTKVSTAVVGTVLAFDGFNKGSEATKKAVKAVSGEIKEYNDYMKDTTIGLAELTAGAALIGTTIAPGIGTAIGALVGAIAGLGQSIYSHFEIIDSIVERDYFGDLTLSAEELANINGIIMNSVYSVKDAYDEFENTLKTNSEAFKENYEDADTLIYKYKDLGTEITGITSKDVITGISKTCKSATNLIDTTTNDIIDILSTQFKHTTDISKKEQKTILTNLTTGSTTRKNKIQEVENKIYEIYENAMKERGYLNEKEIEAIQTHYQRIAEFTKTETEMAGIELNRIVENALQNNNSLSKEALDDYVEQVTTSYENATNKVEENYDAQYEAAKKAGQLIYENMLSEGKSKEEALKAYNETVTTLQNDADQQRITQLNNLNQKVSKLNGQVLQGVINNYIELNKKTDKELTETEKSAKKKLENILIAAGYTKTDLKNIMTQVGSEAYKGLEQGFGKYDFTPNINADKSVLYTKGKEMGGELGKGVYDGFKYSNFPKLNATMIDSNTGVQTNIAQINWRAYATGGFPDIGEMFIAREAGPELVGRIGNSSAVVNNQQIVESVSRGVAQAVSQVMNKQQGGSYKFYLDGKEMTSVITKIQNRNLSVMGV